jgi:hypothetical protein
MFKNEREGLESNVKIKTAHPRPFTMTLMHGATVIGYEKKSSLRTECRNLLPAMTFTVRRRDGRDQGLIDRRTLLPSRPSVPGLRIELARSLTLTLTRQAKTVKH